jgi:hypothetical protein
MGPLQSQGSQLLHLQPHRVSLLFKLIPDGQNIVLRRGDYDSKPEEQADVLGVAVQVDPREKQTLENPGFSRDGRKALKPGAFMLYE